MTDKETPPVDVIAGDQITVESTDYNSPPIIDVIVDEVVVDVVTDQVTDVDVFVLAGLPGPPGPQGPQGPPGPPGPQGEGGTDVESLAYRHVQVTASDSWIINHPLPFQPNVTVIDSAGQEIWPGQVNYLSSSTIELTFSSSVGGEAYLT